MTSQRPLPGFKDAAPPDRYGDLVLTGGVTSAIAYPGVIFGLAQVYRFHAIGGSSSGAGSAALAAAAEYRRRHGSGEGFNLLVQRTQQVADCFEGKTGLAWLFQPGSRTQRLFRALLPAFAGPDHRRLGLVNGIVQAYAPCLLLALLGSTAWTVGLAWVTGSLGLGWLAAWALLLPLLCVAFILTAMRSALLAAIDADFGLCSGMPEGDGAPHPPITPWLHALIQDIAGLPHDRPLTFEDLARAPGGPAQTLADNARSSRPSIDLRMFAANLTAARPLILPLTEDEPALYFRADEFRRLFPAAVVNAMCQPPQQPERYPVARIPRRGKGEVRPMAKAAEHDFWPLPRERLPVLVAARMSVSFPILFSGVPLWCLDSARREMRRMLIVDGGLCSNFPVHLFDSPVPAWPTFGVALRDTDRRIDEDPDRADRYVSVPDSAVEPAPQRGHPFDPAGTPLARVAAYAEAALRTVKDWNDTLQSELPGVRERLATIGLPKNIGGLNILMTPRQIDWLAMAGKGAAQKLLQRYALPDDQAPQGPGWREHRWVRFNVLAECLRDLTAGVSRSVQGGRYSQALREQIRDAVHRAPLPGEVPLLPAQAAQLEQVLDALLALEAHLGEPPLDQPLQLRPSPELRVRPPL